MSSKDSTYSISLDHVTRIEGHGSVRVSVRDGRVEELTLAIVEAQRFFESFTRG
ncbi:MAG TPA: Ni/Fe hydrogenase subunit alpha, partial [Gammaproteobacteria bacterium]|nr:Ni/Fe hydrogenase subunit alpha [Gammaproteobacteria bacterium]